MEYCKGCKYYYEWFDYIDVAEDFSNIQYCCTFFEDEKCKYNCNHHTNKNNRQYNKMYG